eukprot:747040-Hanusia_phi.AAC.1
MHTTCQRLSAPPKYSSSLSGAGIGIPRPTARLKLHAGLCAALQHQLRSPICKVRRSQLQFPQDQEGDAGHFTNP